MQTLPSSPARRFPGAGPKTALACALIAAALSHACGTPGPRELPTPRRLVVHSGERLTADEEHMQEVDAWLREQMDSIRLDPSFMITLDVGEGPVYPWDALTINEEADTARIETQRTPGAGPIYLVYAHLHLMAAQDRLDRWLPEAAGGTDFEIERAVLARLADAWLYHRAILGAFPYGILDELAYAKDRGFLDAFLLTARPGAFVEARRAWLAEHPSAPEEYVAWFRRTFEREPPGLRNNAASPSASPPR